MRVCVVGQGPSAAGKGDEIDACDFVVRIKAWWVYGAEDAGNRCDALAHYGWGDWQRRPPFSGEHWFTQTAKQVENNPEGWARIEFLARAADLRPIRWATQAMWDIAFARLKSHPSTGFMAVGMALAIKQPDELVLYGYDSTTPTNPNYTDARNGALPPGKLRFPPHHTLAEKRAIAELFEGRWLGESSNVQLIWPNMPELIDTRE